MSTCPEYSHLIPIAQKQSRSSTWQWLVDVTIIGTSHFCPENIIGKKSGTPSEMQVHPANSISNISENWWFSRSLGPNVTVLLPIVILPKEMPRCEVSWNRAIPINHPFVHRDFLWNQPAVGVTPWLRKSPYVMSNRWILQGACSRTAPKGRLWHVKCRPRIPVACRDSKCAKCDVSCSLG